MEIRVTRPAFLACVVMILEWIGPLDIVIQQNWRRSLVTVSATNRANYWFYKHCLGQRLEEEEEEDADDEVYGC